MDPSPVNCCEGNEDTCRFLGDRSENKSRIEDKNIDSSQIHHLELIIREMEKKYEQSLQTAKEEWQIKFESHERTIACLTKELAETNMHSKITRANGRSPTHTFLPIDSDTSSSASVNSVDSAVLETDESELPRTLVLDKSQLRGSQSERDSNDLSSNSMLQESDFSQGIPSNQCLKNSSTPISMERLLTVPQDFEKQSLQIASLKNDLVSVLSIVELLRDETIRSREKCSSNFDVLTSQMWKIEAELEAIKSSGQENLSILNTNEQKVELSQQDVAGHIQSESERLMQTWGAQFDDLVIYLQDNLDKQSACIAETRTSTFEHVDADSQRREALWNSKISEILCQNRQYDNMIQELRDDQERSFLIIVDTLVSLKTKCQSISERTDEFEVLSRQGCEPQSTFRKYDAKFQALKNVVDHAMKDIVDIMEDRESVQNILTSSVELLNAKIDSKFDLWNQQIESLEKRVKEKTEAGLKQIQNLNKFRREIEMVVTAVCKKIGDLASRFENQLSDIESVKKMVENHLLTVNQPLLSHGSVEVVHGDSMVKYVKVDQKKYKKILRNSRQKTGSLLGENYENEIEFYDLTFSTE